jgi:sulfur-oxidizing protein SoxZ
MSDIKIRATANGDTVDIKSLMNHPMETGLRKDTKTGQLVPMHFIKTLTVTVAGKTVMKAQWGPGVSKNPYLAMKVKGAKAGDKVVISWEDNIGEKDSAETTVG